MGALTKTVTNSVSVFGLAPTNRWGTFVYASNSTWVWAYKNYPVDVLKETVMGITNNLITTDRVEKKIQKLIVDSFPVTGIIYKEPHKLISGNSFTVTGNVTQKNVDKYVSDPLTATNAIARHFNKLIKFDVIATADMSNETLSDSQGYIKFQTGSVENGESRIFPTYSTSTPATATWVSFTATAVTWST